MKIITLFEEPYFCSSYMYDNTVKIENIQLIPDVDPMKFERITHYGKTFDSRPYIPGEVFDCDLLIWKSFDYFYCPKWNSLWNSIKQCTAPKVLRNIKSMDCCKTFTEDNNYFWRNTSKVMDGALYTDQGNDELLLRNFGYKNLIEYPFVIDQCFVDATVDYNKVENKVMYGYGGFSFDRLYEYTSVFGNAIIRDLPIKKTTLIPNQGNDPGYSRTSAWTMDDIEIVRKLNTPNLMEYMQTLLCTINGGIGRTPLECMAMGVPSFGDIMPYKEPNKFTMPGFELFNRKEQEKHEMVKRMLDDKNYRIELGDASRVFASKFGSVNQRKNWKITIEQCLQW